MIFTIFKVENPFDQIGRCGVLLIWENIKRKWMVTLYFLEIGVVDGKEWDEIK